jgi:DNA-binding ferritin-like protein (Dps family)
MINDVLKGEYKDTYTTIVMYLSSSNIPNDFINEVSEDVKDLLVSAQNDEMDIKDIVGNNIESFCKEIIKTKKFKNQTVFNVVKNINLALFMSVITSLGYYLVNIPMTLNVIFMFITNYLFCTFIFIRGLRKAIIKGKGNVKKIAMISFSFVLFVITASILNYILLTSYVIQVDSLYTAVVLLITMIGIHIVAKILRDRKIKILN